MYLFICSFVFLFVSPSIYSLLPSFYSISSVCYFIFFLSFLFPVFAGHTSLNCNKDVAVNSIHRYSSACVVVFVVVLV